jgi:hypothetical protein
VKDQLMRDFAHHRDMPAIKLLPHRTCESESCMLIGMARPCSSWYLLCMLGQTPCLWATATQTSSKPCMCAQADAVPRGSMWLRTSK